jgi:putative lipoprotein
MRIIKQSFWAALAAVAMGAFVFAACNDNASKVGFTTQPKDEVLTAKADTFLLSAQTVEVPSIYSRSTYTLLGQLSDPLFGDLRSSYVTRLRHAPGFKFAHEPEGKKIDSAFVEISYSSWAGDSTLWAKASIYEVTKPLPDSHYSGDIRSYLQGAKHLGSGSYKAENKTGDHFIYIPVDKAIGQRFYDASVQHPEYFESQKAFEENLLRGIYVESSTGSGCMLSVYSTALLIYYTYTVNGKTADGKADSVIHRRASYRFANTNQLYLSQQFDHANRDELLKPNSKYSFITSPLGLATELTLTKEDLNRVVRSGWSPKTKRLFNEAKLTLPVDIPADGRTVLQPPKYLLLLPADSVKTFFETGQSHLTQPDVAFLSSEYSILSREYNFSNISKLITQHIENHKSETSSSIEIKQPLRLLLVPVSLEGGKSGSSSSDVTGVAHYLFPSGVRIKLDNGKIRLGIVHTTYE